MSGQGKRQPKKILLVRAGRGGDLIMITPALNALLEIYPEAEFHLLTTGDGRRIMKGFHPRVAGVHLYDRRFPRTLLLQRQLKRQFIEEGFDRIYTFETKPHYRSWLAGVAPENYCLEGTSAAGHYSRRCLDLVQSSSGQEINRGWVKLPVEQEGVDRARGLLAENGVAPDSLLVGLHPTFSGTGLPFFRDRQGNRHRMWPGSSFARLASLLMDEARAWDRPLALIIDALPEDLAHVRPIVEESGGAITVLSAPPDFQRYKGLLTLLDVLVTPNTGPMHMAAALETRLVALFSGWSPDDCGPYMDPESYRILRAEDTDVPDKGLAAIEPESVVGAVKDLLGPVVNC